ncbi:MAG TPA: DNA cytosine methyltransferase [Pyrinomonadaceae bacterium]|jgi:DNA (cytosine-5)-methyltransferase 1|nr:DNA cytosine methyltransferase [Pyrinomonadaceae bacterium]
MDFYEFFAGGGMARLGLGPSWRCVFANDNDLKKAECYRARFGVEQRLIVDDIENLSVQTLPNGRADLAWASFPCQDLSLAGAGAGLKGERSGTFWPFWRLMQGLRREGRAPRAIVLENVYGAITSHEGRDLAVIGEELAAGGYRFGPLMIDAARFLPQSRPRLFVVAFDTSVKTPDDLLGSAPVDEWHPDALGLSYDRLTARARASWVWWNMTSPPASCLTLEDLIEDEPVGVDWHTQYETKYLLSLMTPLNREKVKAAQLSGERKVGTLYRRTRKDSEGVKKQRAEVRFDGVAGCLRVPVGGSSRQTIIVVEGKKICSRLLSPREAARLMGLPEDYPLPANYNDAYHLSGDGVVVPVVSYLAEHLLNPILQLQDEQKKNAA